MRKIEISASATIYKNISELSLEDKMLMEKAIEIRKTAYAPYSKFKVSAVCQMENGVVVKGTNQENGAYPSGLCAERVAIFSAKSQFPDQKVAKIVVTTEETTSSPISPVCKNPSSLITSFVNSG